MRLQLRIAGVACLTSIALDVQAQPIRVSERPILRIDEQVDTAAEFTRITGAFQLPSGQLAVADARVAAACLLGTIDLISR